MTAFFLLRTPSTSCPASRQNNISRETAAGAPLVLVGSYPLRSFFCFYFVRITGEKGCNTNVMFRIFAQFFNFSAYARKKKGLHLLLLCKIERAQISNHAKMIATAVYSVIDATQPIGVSDSTGEVLRHALKALHWWEGFRCT